MIASSSDESAIDIHNGVSNCQSDSLDLGKERLEREGELSHDCSSSLSIDREDRLVVQSGLPIYR